MDLSAPEQAADESALQNGTTVLQTPLCPLVDFPPAALQLSNILCELGAPIRDNKEHHHQTQMYTGSSRIKLRVEFNLAEWQHVDYAFLSSMQFVHLKQGINAVRGKGGKGSGGRPSLKGCLYVPHCSDVVQWRHLSGGFAAAVGCSFEMQ